MKIEIEAEVYGEKVHISIGGELVAVVEARGDYYGTPPKMRIARSVAAWFQDLEDMRAKTFEEKGDK